MINAFAMGAALVLAAASSPHYSVVERIPGPDGEYDYISVDGERVYVAREHGVMVVNLATRAVTERLVEIASASAVLVIPGTNLMLTTEYDADQVVLFDRDTGAVKARIPAGKAPDGALYDPVSALAFVMNAKSNDVTLIDLTQAKAVGTLALNGKPEAGVADGHGHVFINIEDTAEIAVVDSKSRKVTKRIKLDDCVEPTGIAYDSVGATLVSACHNGIARLIDAQTGASRGAVKIGADADGALFDSERRIVWIPGDDGTLTWFRLETNGRVTVVDNVPTEPGARTAALDPKTGRIYLPAQQTPGTFKVLVVAPTPRTPPRAP
jgi:DNA-binding beta-propeller fold protein YncE